MKTPARLGTAAVPALREPHIRRIAAAAKAAGLDGAFSGHSPQGWSGGRPGLALRALFPSSFGATAPEGVGSASYN